MTTAPAVAFVAALAPIAREVGVALPSPQAWSARLTAIEDIDVEVLTDGSRRLRSMAEQVTDVAATIGDVADDLPTAWNGIAGKRAHSAVADVHSSCDETAHRLHTAAAATSAAARGIADLRHALHVTLAAVPGLVLAGRAIAELTRLDLETNRAVVAALLQATVTTVETALTVTESAITDVLTVLADSTGGLAEPPRAGAPRTDVGHRPRPTVDATGVVGALAGAGAVTATAVGMAAVGAASVVAQVVDTVLDTDPTEPGSPIPPSAEAPRTAAPQSEATQQPETTQQPGPADRTDLPGPDVGEHRDRPTGVRPQLNLRYDDEPSREPGAPDPAVPDQAPADPVPATPPAARADPAPPAEAPAQHEAPAAVTRSGPPATPDPDDGGGLALAGDR